MITRKTPCCPTYRLCVGAYHSVTMHAVKNLLDLAGDFIFIVYCLFFIPLFFNLSNFHSSFAVGALYSTLYCPGVATMQTYPLWDNKGIILSYLNLSYLTLFFATLWENGQVPSACLHVPRRNLHRNSENRQENTRDDVPKTPIMQQKLHFHQSAPLIISRRT